MGDPREALRGLEETMSTQLVFDEEAARRIESIYLIGDAVRRRQIVR